MSYIWSEIKMSHIKLPLDILEDISKSFNTSFSGIMSMVIVENKASAIDHFINTIGKQEKQLDVDHEVLLKVVVPLLENYEMFVLKVSYKVSTVYPCSLMDYVNGNVSYNCADSYALEEKLRNVFDSVKFKNAASVLMTQAERIRKKNK